MYMFFIFSGIADILVISFPLHILKGKFGKIYNNVKRPYRHQPNSPGILLTFQVPNTSFLHWL